MTLRTAIEVLNQIKQDLRYVVIEDDWDQSKVTYFDNLDKAVAYFESRENAKSFSIVIATKNLRS